MWQYNYELYHYASKYYDPQKAHEYYEKHKQLKGGRLSTAGLNEEGRKTANYVKKQIDEQKTELLKSESESHKREVEQKQKEKTDTIEKHNKVMTQRINSLKNALKRMSPAQRESEAPRIKNIIYKLKEENNKKKYELEAKHKQWSSNASLKTSENKQKIREYSDNEYQNELSKIHSDSSMVSEKRRSSKSVS